MSGPTLRAITNFSVVTADLPRLVQFYRDVLGFTTQGEERPIDQAETALLGLSGAGRRQMMSLGKQNISIDQFEKAGRPYPPDSDAASLWFQHVALVVPDIGEAFARLRDVAPISRGGPQQLPSSSGGVRAFKFRDPDGHPLELLQFPRDRTPNAWRPDHKLAGQIGLGIDHSAISVADADASAAFYGALGLDTGERSLNEGPEQQRLDDLRRVKVAVVPMIPFEGTPHLELLGYQIPSGDRGPALEANDVAATRIIWGGAEAKLIRDPDGHLHQVHEYGC
jgi:catechol 2,3-dioxygenase-like lactoylglutathione lyase family enzyme